MKIISIAVDKDGDIYGLGDDGELYYRLDRQGIYVWDILETRYPEEEAPK